MNETTKNFWEAWNTFEWPESKPVFFRLYYNEDGTPRFYSMEDLPGEYVEVDAEAYAIASFNVRVVEHKLIHIRPRISIQKLQTHLNIGTACDPTDVCVIVSEQDPHIKWSIVHNEIN
jgi:hypothetical protein